MKSSNLFLSLLCLGALLNAGCSETVEVTAIAGAAEIVNTKCPIMGGDIDSSLTKDWNGKKVAFCCPPCLEEWDELTDTEKAEKIAHPSEGHGEASHDHGDRGTTDHDHATPDDKAPADDSSAKESTSQASEEPAPANP